IIIVPGMKQAAFGIGAKWGRGYAVCRQNRAGWGAPAAIRVEGGSFGFQIGGSNTDIVMLVMNERGMRHLLEDKVTLGAEATVAAGPVGRQTAASTDVQASAEILSYSRSKGLFAGIALHGATMRPDNEVNEELYGSKLTNKEILMGGQKPPCRRREMYSCLGPLPAAGEKGQADRVPFRRQGEELGLRPRDSLLTKTRSLTLGALIGAPTVREGLLQLHIRLRRARLEGNYRCRGRFDQLQHPLQFLLLHRLGQHELPVPFEVRRKLGIVAVREPDEQI